MRKSFTKIKEAGWKLIVEADSEDQKESSNLDENSMKKISNVSTMMPTEHYNSVHRFSGPI